MRRMTQLVKLSSDPANNLSVAGPSRQPLPAQRVSLHKCQSIAVSCDFSPSYALPT